MARSSLLVVTVLWSVLGAVFCEYCSFELDCPDACCCQPYTTYHCCDCTSKLVGGIVGVVITAVIVIILIVVCCCCCPGCPGHRRKYPQHQHYTPGGGTVIQSVQLQPGAMHASSVQTNNAYIPPPGPYVAPPSYSPSGNYPDSQVMAPPDYNAVINNTSTTYPTDPASSYQGDTAHQDGVTEEEKISQPPVYDNGGFNQS